MIKTPVFSSHPPPNKRVSEKSSVVFLSLVYVYKVIILL